MTDYNLNANENKIIENKIMYGNRTKTDYNLTANENKIMYGNRTKEEKKKLPSNKIKVLKTINIIIKQLNKLSYGAYKLNKLIKRIEERPKSVIEKVPLDEYCTILKMVKDLIDGYIRNIYENLEKLNNQLWKMSNVKNILESKKLIAYIIYKLNTEFKEKLTGDPKIELSKLLPKNLPRNTKVYKFSLTNVGEKCLYEQLVVFSKKYIKI